MIEENLISWNGAFARIVPENDAEDRNVMDCWGHLENDGKYHIRFNLSEHYPSGKYHIAYIALKDSARNEINIYDYGSVLSKENLDFYVPTITPDLVGPQLDLDKITIEAMPTNPTNPDGETKVKITYYVKDNLSGYDHGKYVLRDPQGLTHYEYTYTENYGRLYFKGDPTVWTKYEINVILPKGSAPGIWGLEELTLWDMSEKGKTYNFTEIIHFEIFS